MRPETGTEGRAALSRELAEFLIELSIALHKHAMYPGGHPTLGPAVGAVVQRLQLLFEKRDRLSLGVARQQLVIEGVATDAKHPVLRDLAGRLHRHHLGAVSFVRGVTEAELADVLHTLSLEAERTGEPIGLGPREALNAWPHVRLHAITYGELELVDDAPPTGEPDREGATRAAQLWIGLARAALAAEQSDEPPPSTEPTVVARAIEGRPRGTAYDQVIVGYLLQIADELKAAGGADAAALRRRMSHLVSSLNPQTLRRLVDMGGDVGQRRRFVLDASYGMAVDTVMDVVQAVADTSRQHVSHSLVRLLSKLSVHARGANEHVRGQADQALREQVRQLIGSWEPADPVPDDYSRALQRISSSVPLFSVPSAAVAPAEPLRIVQTSLEVETAGPLVWRAVDALVEAGRLGELLQALDEAPADGAVVREFWDHVATPERLAQLLVAQPVDFDLVDRLVGVMGVSAAEPLLDALADAEGQGTRRRLLDRLVGLGPAIGPAVARRLQDERWYVIRNLLALLAELPEWPDGFSPAAYGAHDDPRVRREALKLLLRVPEERERALCAALTDDDARLLRLALAAAQEACPEAAVPLLVSRLQGEGLSAALRVAALRALGTVQSPMALEALLGAVQAGRTILGRPKLVAKSPEMLAALAALAAGWRQDPRAADILARAHKASDEEIRSAAQAAVAQRG